MPQSKHRRKGKARPRPRTIEAERTPPKPPPSPPWVPRLGGGLIGIGTLIIILGYFEPVQRVTDSLPFAPNFGLVFGFVLLSVGFVVLTRWR